MKSGFPPLKIALGFFVFAAMLAALACSSAQPQPAAPAAPSIDTAELRTLVEDAVKSASSSEPAISIEDIQELVETAVSAAAAEGTSPEELQRMIDQGVASASTGASRDEIEELVAKAVADTAASQQPGVSAEDVQKIVAAAISDIPTPSGEKKILRISENFVPGDFNSMTGSTPKEFLWATTSVLIKPDPATNEFVGDLADTWEVSPAGDSYTFHIRDNAKWHDGTPVTAKDVEFTFTRLLNPATGSRSMGALALIKGGEAYTAGDATTVEGIKVLDEQTIQFDMEFPNVLFLNEVGATYERAILPEHILGDVAPEDMRNQDFFKDSPVGSGPFKFTRYVEGQFFVMDAFDDYYLGRPKIDQIIVNIVLSSEAAQIAFERGDFHALSFDGGADATTEMFQSAIDDPNSNVGAEEGSTLISYAFNSRVPELEDPRIRQAFLHALDRQTLIDTFVSGNGTIYNSFMTHGWYQKPEWADLYPYDPQKASDLLEEAGWDSDRVVRVKIITVGSEENRAMLAAEQAMLAEAGFKIEFDEVALPVWVDAFYSTYDWEMIRVTFGVFGDPDGFLNFHLKTGSRNAMGYANPELDEKIEAGRRAIDRDDRIEIYQDINEEMLTTLPLAPVYLKNFWTIMSREWYVPGLSDLPPSTSFKDVPTFPIFARAGEVFGLAPHLWELR